MDKIYKIDIGRGVSVYVQKHNTNGAAAIDEKTLQKEIIGFFSKYKIVRIENIENIENIRNNDKDDINDNDINETELANFPSPKERMWIALNCLPDIFDIDDYVKQFGNLRYNKDKARRAFYGDMDILTNTKNVVLLRKGVRDHKGKYKILDRTPCPTADKTLMRKLLEEHKIRLGI